MTKAVTEFNMHVNVLKHIGSAENITTKIKTVHAL